MTCLLLSLQNFLKSGWSPASPNPYKQYILLLCCYSHWAHAPCQPCSGCSCSSMVPGVLSPFRTPISKREGKCVWKPAQELYSSAVSHSCVDITAVVAGESWRTAFSVSLALSCWCEVPACGTDSGCSHGRLCRHFALKLGAAGVCCWPERQERSSGL